jgi:hypothetical protein
MATVTFFFADQADSTVQLERQGDAGAKGVRQALITFDSAVDAGLTPLGERTLKGIAEPVAVAAVDWAPEEEQ